MRMFAPQCFVPCMGSCSAVGKAVDAYFASGVSAAEQSVCRHKSSWACFVTPNHIGACQPLVKKAAKFGYHMPRSMGELDSLCSRYVAAAVAAPDVVQAPALPAASQLVASSSAELSTQSAGDACHSGKVGLMRMFAPQCFVPCMGSCSAVGKAVDAYFASGVSAAEQSVCRHKSSWACFVTPNHIGACQPLVKKAAKFGYHMPRSMGELDSLCSRYTKAADVFYP